jgi:hypothetical protein
MRLAVRPRFCTRVFVDIAAGRDVRREGYSGSDRKLLAVSYSEGNCACHVGLVDDAVMCVRMLLCHSFDTRIEASQV